MNFVCAGSSNYENSKSHACAHPERRGRSMEDCIAERGVGIKRPGRR